MHFRNNRELVEWLVKNGYIKSEAVKRAFLEVDRKDFIGKENEDMAYVDSPVPIGYNQTTSQPSLIATMLELLELKPGEKVLDVGCGTGYTTVLISKIVGKNGKVIGIERIEELCKKAKENVEKYKSENVEIICSDGTLGYPKYAPYDKIFVGAAAPEIPKPLIWQLKTGGKMIIPVGPEYNQVLYLIEKKNNGSIVKYPINYVSFVPLIGKYGYDEEEWY